MLGKLRRLIRAAVELLLGLLAALALSSLGVVPVGGDPDEVVGYCDNPRGYYYGEAITRRLADAEKEECGMRRCWGCSYFVPRHELESAGWDEDAWEEKRCREEAHWEPYADV